MRRILIIADDLTGAAEIAGIAAEHGLSARVQFDEFSGGSAAALAVDTDTRSLSAQDAAARLREIFSGIGPTQFDLIFKKTDSVLRGPVAAEIEAIMEIVGLRQCILVPQNPSRGRVIENGEYRVNGIALNLTTFAADPEHPAGTADVQKLIGGGAQYRPRGEPPAPKGISIGEGTSAGDIRYWASCVDRSILPAGGADFFTAILRAGALGPKHSKMVAKERGKTLVVFGSASASSREFVAGIGKPICAMPSAVFDPASKDGPGDWVRDICGQLQSSEFAFVAPHEEHIASRARHVREMTARAVGETLAKCEVANLFIEGGATAAAIVRQMGWREFRIVGSFAPGVVALRNESATGPLIVIKPGSYPWPAEAF